VAFGWCPITLSSGKAVNLVYMTGLRIGWNLLLALGNGKFFGWLLDYLCTMIFFLETHMKFQLYRLLLPVVMFAQVGCVGKQQQTPSTLPAAQQCTYSFEAKASDSVAIEGKVQRIYSVYVDNALNPEEIKKCASVFEKDAQARSAKAHVARVYYFNCPHHTPTLTSGDSVNLSAKNFYVAQEMYPYCVGMVELGEQLPKPRFNPIPFSL
jgi:hypothetical protein